MISQKTRIDREPRPSWQWLRQWLRRCLGGPAMIGVLLLGVASQGDAQPRPLSERNAQEGVIAKMEREAYSGNGSSDLKRRAEVAQLKGDLEAALKWGKEAAAAATNDLERIEANLIEAQVLREKGELESAETLLRTGFVQQPQHHATRLELGKLLIQRGKYGEAKAVLEALGDFYNRGLLTSVEDLTILGEAMQLLRQYKDANRAYAEALKKDSDAVETKLRFATLFLETYNLEEAEKLYQEVLKTQPGHPLGRLGLVRISLRTSNQTDAIRFALDSASIEIPHNRETMLLRSEIAMSALDCETATAEATKLVAQRPTDLKGLTVLGVCATFGEDSKRAKEIEERIFAINPSYAEYYSALGKQAELRNRYPEGIAYHKKALQLQQNDPQAVLELAIGYTRSRKEDLAAPLLDQAFALDRYNVRAYNLKNLYRKVLPTLYRDEQQSRYLLRAHKEESRLLKPLVDPLIREALKQYDSKYGIQAEERLSVEIYAEPSTFAVRTTGLPSISPHGICFGPVVLSRSPKEGNFNWAQILWHELAHVYHLQLSKSRVPRWFTEGLAEYETNIKDPSWNRYHDQEIADALFHGELVGVDELSNQFSHATSDRAIVRAYQQSSLAVHYLAEHWGFDVIPKMLRAWGAKKNQQEVFQQVLGVSTATFDQGFKAWLTDHYGIFRRMMPSITPVYTPPEEIEKRLQANPEDLSARVRRSFNLLLMGSRKGALREFGEIERLVLEQKSKLDPWILAVLANMAHLYGNDQKGYDLGKRALKEGGEGVELRLLMGDVSRRLGKMEESWIHYRSSVALWRNTLEGWRGLGELAKLRGKGELQRAALEEVFRLNQHDPGSARRLYQLMEGEQDREGMRRSSARWLEVAPFDIGSLRAVAKTALLDGDQQRLEWVKKVWQGLPSQTPADVDREIASWKENK